jgi:hypothetical protein
MKLKLEQENKTDNLEIQIQDRFMKFKKAEQEFMELLNQIGSEEQFIEIMSKLSALDNRIRVIKPQAQAGQPSYIG